MKNPYFVSDVDTLIDKYVKEIDDHLRLNDKKAEMSVEEFVSLPGIADDIAKRKSFMPSGEAAKNKPDVGQVVLNEGFWSEVQYRLNKIAGKGV